MASSSSSLYSVAESATDARSALLVGQLEEFRKHLLGLALGEPATAVANGDGRHRAIGRSGNLDGRSVWRKLSRVAQQVVQHLAEPSRVRHEWGHTRQVRPEHRASARRTLKRAAGVVDGRAQLDRLRRHRQRTRLDARDVEQVIARGYPGVFVEGPSRMARDFSVLSQSTKLGIAKDGVVQLVEGYGTLSDTRWRQLLAALAAR
jgi:hypothetical protein